MIQAVALHCIDDAQIKLPVTQLIGNGFAHRAFIHQHPHQQPRLGGTRQGLVRVGGDAVSKGAGIITDAGNLRHRRQGRIKGKHKWLPGLQGFTVAGDRPRSQLIFAGNEFHPGKIQFPVPIGIRQH